MDVTAVSAAILDDETTVQVVEDDEVKNGAERRWVQLHQNPTFFI